MPSLYIILEKKIPGADTHVDGNVLSKRSKELERMAKTLGVTPLMSFFSVSKQELESLEEEYATSLKKAEEKWFSAEEGLRTVNALLRNLQQPGLDDSARIETDLQEFAKVLELAKASGIRWHLAVDY
jgi:hypothetical protein